MSDEDRRALYLLWKELRNFGRRRRPEYIGQQETFNAWLTRLTMERAAQVHAELAQADAAQTFGTVEPMTKIAVPAKRRPKASDPPEPAAPLRPIRGRPRGTYKENLTLSLDKDIIAWLKAQPAGPSAAANAVLRRSLRRRKSPQ